MKTLTLPGAAIEGVQQVHRQDLELREIGAEPQQRGRKSTQERAFREKSADEGAAPHATPFGGNFRFRARNASAMSEPTVVSGSGRLQGSSVSSDSSILRRWLICFAIPPRSVCGRETRFQNECPHRPKTRSVRREDRSTVLLCARRDWRHMNGDSRMFPVELVEHRYVDSGLSYLSWL